MAASGLGSMVVRPRSAWRRMASATAGGRMTEHGAGIAETEIDIAVSVGVRERDAAGFSDEERVGRTPIDHPVHRHAVEPMFRGPFRQGVRHRRSFGKAHALAGKQRCNALRINSGAVG